MDGRIFSSFDFIILSKDNFKSISTLESSFLILSIAIGHLDLNSLLDNFYFFLHKSASIFVDFVSRRFRRFGLESPSG